MPHEVLRRERDPRGVLRLTLDRPELRNAFSEDLQAALADAFEQLDERTRVVVLTGTGSAFSAGADIRWMRAAAGNSFDDNVADSRRFEAMLAAVDRCPVPVIARVNGHALGGAVGLVACADVTIAVADATFGFTEVRLGLAPAMISHYVLRRTGLGPARRYFLTGERFDADRAARIGLIDEVVADQAALDGAIDALVDAILEGAPAAQRETKALAHRLAAAGDPDETVDDRVELIARLRVGEEGQEGLGAFLDKRRPTWQRRT